MSNVEERLARAYKKGFDKGTLECFNAVKAKRGPLLWKRSILELLHYVWFDFNEREEVNDD